MLFLQAQSSLILFILFNLKLCKCGTHKIGKPYFFVAKMLKTAFFCQKNLIYGIFIANICLLRIKFWIIQALRILTNLWQSAYDKTFLLGMAMRMQKMRIHVRYALIYKANKLHNMRMRMRCG